MSNSASTRRNPSLSGSSRLSLSVGKTSSAVPEKQERHPLKHDWSISYVNRPPGAKVVDYTNVTKRVATFGSVESFLHLYSHIAPVNEMAASTDVLVFLSRIQLPGVWEELPNGGRFSIRLFHDIAPLLFENLLFGLIGDQFEDSDGVVGGVIAIRPNEALLSVWVEEETEAVKSGQLKDKILSLLGLPAGTTCEYNPSKVLIQGVNKTQPDAGGHDGHHGRGYNNQNHHHHQNHQNNNTSNHNQRENQHFTRDREGQQHAHHRYDRNHNNNGQRGGGGGGGGGGFRRGGGGEEEGGAGEQQPTHHRTPRERPEGREPRSTAWGR